MIPTVSGWLVMVLILGQVWTDPVGYHEAEARPLGVMSDIGQHLSAHGPRLQASAAAVEPRLLLPALPSPQDLEAIKKVAQILVMLGEQVIPAITGDSPQRPAVLCDSAPPEDVPNDSVADL